MQSHRKHGGVFYFGIGFLVPFLITLIGFIVIGVWPSGDGTVLIIDSLHQYLPFYTDFHEKLTHNGSLFYSFSAGFGYNFWTTYAYYLASPLNFLITLVPKANVCDFMDLIILIKIGLCGGAFSWYLHRRNTRSCVLPIAFGTMYALSFFVIGYYFNLMWLDSVAMLPLIMGGIEQICGIGNNRRLTDGSDGRLYGLALFYGIWCNYYIGFMLCIFSVLYFAVCMVSAGRCRIRRFLGRALRFGIYSLLAGAMTAVLTIPAYIGLTASESMENNKFPMVLQFFDSLPDMILTHFAGIRPINIANTQVGLNGYCGVIVLILVVLFALDSKIALRERIARFLLIAFLLLSVSLKPLNYIWHGFHQQNGLPNRFAFLYVGVLLVMAFDAVRDLQSMRLWRILVSGAVPIGFALIMFFGQFGRDYEDNPYPDYVYILTIALLLGYFFVLLILRMKHASRRKAALILSALCIAEASASGIFGIRCNDSVTRSIYLKDQESYQNLMDEIGDTGWYRSEVDAQRMRNVTLFCGGNSVVLFNSTMQQSVTDFCDRIGMEARTNKNGYNGVTGLMNDVFGIKYVLSTHGTGSTFYGFPEIASDGNLTVYENEDALPIGFLVNSEITQWDLSGSTPIDVQEAFVRLATGHEPIFRLDRNLTMTSGEANGIVIPEDKEVIVYLPNRVKEIRLTTPEYDKTYTTFTDHLYVINGCDENKDAVLTATIDAGGTANAAIYTCPKSQVREVRDLLAQNPLENIEIRGNRLSGDIRADRDGELFLSIPYDENWICLVDGERVKADLIGECMTGIPLTEGEHRIEMEFIPAKLVPGLILSLLAAALMVLMCILDAGRKRKDMIRETNSVSEDVIDEIMDIVGEENVLESEPMKDHTTFKIGGPCDLFVTPADEASLISTLRTLRERNIPFHVIGNGSNLLVSDEGIRGAVIRIGKNLSAIEIDGTVIRAQAGATLAAIAQRALEAELTGMECLSGIPGTLGGALSMNAGAYGAEMKDITVSVRVLEADGTVRELDREEMAFGYRTSAVQQGGMYVLSAVLKLTENNRDEIAKKMQEIRAKRQEKQPLEMPSAGSTFKRPEGYFAGALIDEAGLRGYRVGGAQVSEKHCGFVVNTGKATACDVQQLILDVQRIVYEKSGVKLEPEVKFL